MRRSASFMLLALVAMVACTSSGDPASPSTTVTTLVDGGVDAGPALTWYRDVEPIVQVACIGCHVTNGTGGFPMDLATSVSLAGYIAGRVSTEYMPPWPPAPPATTAMDGGVTLANARGLTSDEIAVFVGWAALGAPVGDVADHVDRAPRTPMLPARSADLRLTMPAVYISPSSAFITDEVRCFVLDLPSTLTDGAWITASSWHAGTPIGIHSLSGVPLDPAAAATAHALENQDGRAGFECGAGFGDLPHGPPIGANGTGASADGSQLPGGTAVVVPAGGAILMRVHYAVKHLGGATDQSSLDLWLAGETERASLAPLDLVTVSAPAEVPCPTGLSDDPTDACNRDNAFTRLALGPDTPSLAKARADALFGACGTSYANYVARLTFGSANDDHFYVPSSCDTAATEDGTLRIVHPRMLTRGASVKLEVEGDHQTFQTIIDIPTWRWAWDGAYVLEDGVAIKSGRRIRVTCTFDNGTIPQWSALTGEPGHDNPARPPVLPAAYIVATNNRAAEACTVYLGIEPTARLQGSRGQIRRSSQVAVVSP